MTDSENISSGTYTSTNKDENVILASNVTSTISDISVIKSGDSKGGDNTSFYGTNSAIIAKDGANLTLKTLMLLQMQLVQMVCFVMVAVQLLTTHRMMEHH